MDFNELEELRQLSPNKFIQTASNHYKIRPSAFKALLDDYDLFPKDAFGPPGDAPVDLSMREIAERVALPIKVVGRLQDMGVIGSPITCDDFDFLKFFRITWGNVFLLRSQLARFSQKQREELISRPELAEKWQRWVYSRYFFNEIEYNDDRRMLNPGARIRVSSLAEDLESLFYVPNCQNTRETILKIREIANNDRKKVMKGASEKDVLRERKLPDTELDLFIDTFTQNLIL